MEEKHLTDFEDFSQDFGDTEDVISLSHLPIQGYQYEYDPSRRGSTSSDQEPFEFYNNFGPELSTNDTVLFCGKVIDPITGNGFNECWKRDHYFGAKSASFHKVYDREYRSVSKSRSSSLRFEVSEYPRCSPVQISSMPAKSRPRMSFLGTVKFRPEMNVSEIKRRLRRRTPTNIPPMPEKVASGGGKRKSSGGGGGGGGGIQRPLWYKNQITNLLGRSFGCVSASMVM